MTTEDILKLWQRVEALSEIKAKLALFGLVIQKLGHEGQILEGVSAEQIEAARKVLRELSV